MMSRSKNKCVRASSLTDMPFANLLPPLTVAISMAWASNAYGQIAIPNGLGQGQLQGSVRTSPITSISQIRLDLDRKSVPANGLNSANVTITLLDKNGDRIQDDVWLNVEVLGGRLRWPGREASVLDSGWTAVDQVATGDPVKAVAGKVVLNWIAGSQAMTGQMKVSALGLTASTEIDFIPDVRDLMALGLVEGVIRLRRTSNESLNTSVRSQDGFEQELQAFERSFNTGKASAAARIAFFVKGGISGETLLTASYDSDKDTRLKLAKDVRPDQLYPVMGDASVTQTEGANSSGKLFVRLDNGKNYALWGDFNTGNVGADWASNGQTADVRKRDLGAFSRALNGFRTHAENEWGVVNAFAAHDNLVRQIEEMPGNGGSFYNAARSDAVENTDFVEILTRDRYFPSRVVKVSSLQRLVDYTFDPVTGRLILVQPLSSFDSRGNPQSLRLTYELQNGGPAFWVAGADAQVKVGERLEFGAAVMRDQNPSLPANDSEKVLRQLLSANATYALSSNGKLGVEVARSDSETTQGTVSGSASRIELNASDPKLKYRLSAHASRADQGFFNPQASVLPGRKEAGANFEIELSPGWVSTANVLAQRDGLSGAERKIGVAEIAYKPNDQLTVSAGVRNFSDNGLGLTTGVNVGSDARLFGSSGLFNTDPLTTGIASTGGITSNTQAAAPLKTTTAFVSTSVQLSRQISVGVELEKSVQGEDAQRLAFLANWQVSPQARVNLRHETSINTGLTADRGEKSSTWALGLSNGFNSESLGRGDVYSEYRVHDGYSLRSGELASGMRTAVNLSDEWRLALGGERIYSLFGAGAVSNAVTTGLEYLGSSDWRGSTRLEWRNGVNAGAQGGSQTWLHTVSLARRLSQDWTMLARNYWAATDDHLIPGKQSQERFQIGMAYRGAAPSGLDVVAKLEYRNETNSEISGGESRRVYIGSTHANWHPVRPLWLSLRLAAKSVTENLQSQPSNFSATLVGARASYDISPTMDVSVMGQVLSGQGSRQHALGLELGYAMARNLYVGLGYNVSGFVDRDLTGDEYTAKGAFLRLRYKFDEDSFPFLKSGLKEEAKARP